jgi:hypothetical protein
VKIEPSHILKLALKKNKITIIKSPIRMLIEKPLITFAIAARQAE